MQLPDPLLLRYSQPKDKIIFAASLLPGQRPRQEDYFANFNDECFVVTDGVGGMPHGDVAAKLAADTAIWGYKHIRQRPTYWLDKNLLVKRIFRSANIAVWQKHREAGFEAGLATTLLVLLVGQRKIWVGSAGDSSAFLWREGRLNRLTTADIDEYGALTKVIGVQRFGLVPQCSIESFWPDDVALLVTDGITNFVSESEIGEILVSTGETIDSLNQVVARLLRTAQSNGSGDNMTACLVKKVRVGTRS